MSARAALSPRSSPSLLVALFLPLLSFPAFAQLSNKRLCLSVQLRHPADINKPLREAAKEKANKYQHTYANNHSISFLPAIFSTSGRTDAEFLRLLFYHAHRESEEFFRLTGQLAQPNQDYVFSKRAAFFNGLKSKVGHIMAKATALRVNLNLAPSIPSTPRPPTRKSHAHLLYALNLSHHVLSPHGA